MAVFGRCSVRSLCTLPVGTWKAVNDFTQGEKYSALLSALHLYIIISQLVNEKGFPGHSTR